MSRKLLIPLVAAAFLAAPAFAPAPIAAGLSGSAQATKNLNSSRSNIYRSGTQSGTKKGAASRATTVKSSKSNSSERMGGGGGGRGGGSGMRMGGGGGKRGLPF